jgi:hypothetical protein
MKCPLSTGTKNGMLTIESQHVPNAISGIWGYNTFLKNHFSAQRGVFFIDSEII